MTPEHSSGSPKSVMLAILYRGSTRATRLAMSLHLSSFSSSPSPPLPPCLFSCRIVSIEYYMSLPAKELDLCYSSFCSSAVDKVPVLRIFGSTPAGQKTCLHVHGVFPYLYVPCTHHDPSNEYLQLVARSINHALQVSLGASKTVHHVYKIILVKGIPFYGYHEHKQLFLKIYLYNPALIKRLAELLVAGAVMNEVMQPHEAHVPFVLQFMMDHNLYGMNHIHLSDIKFRVIGLDGTGMAKSPGRQRSVTPLSPTLSHSSSSTLYNPSQMVWDVDALPWDKVVHLPRASVCELEADAVGADILNRHELSLVTEGFPGLAALWEEERQRRTTTDIEAPLTPPPSPKRGSQINEEAETHLQDKLDMILHERLRQMSSEDASLQGSPSPPSLGSPVSQPSRPGSTSAADVAVERDVTGGEVVVDEEMVHEVVSLSQRCSVEAVEKSTNDELIELLNELCQSSQLSQPPSSQLSQPPSSQLSQPPSSQLSQPPASQLSQPPSSQLSQPPSSQLSPPPSSQLPPSQLPQPHSLPPSHLFTSHHLQLPSSQLSQPPSSKSSQLPSSQPPSSQPSQPPSSQPSQPPSSQPSQPPSSQPSQPPSSQPSQPPSSQPSQPPSSQPSQPPSSQPSQPLSSQPSQPPSSQPSQFPSSQHLLSPLQSVGELLLRKMKRSASVVSRSLFSTPSVSPPPHLERRNVGGGEGGREQGPSQATRQDPMEGVCSAFSDISASDPVANDETRNDKLIVSIKLQQKDELSARGPAVSHVTCTDKLIISIKLRQRDEFGESSSRFMVEQSSDDKASDVTPAADLVTSASAPVLGLQSNAEEPGDSFSGGTEGEEVDKLLTGSEYNTSCAQPKRKPLSSDISLQQNGTKSPDKLQENHVLEFGAVQTEFEMREGIVTSELSKSACSIADIMEQESLWKLFTEKLSPQMQLSLISSSPERESCVLTERTRGDLVNLVMRDEGGEGEECVCSEGESLELEEEELLQAVWDDGGHAVEGGEEKAFGEERIPQLDGTTSPSVRDSSTSSTPNRPKTPFILGVRKRRSRSSKKSSSPQKDSIQLQTDASVEPAVPVGEASVPQGGVALASLVGENEDNHSSKEDLHSSSSFRVQQRFSLKTKDKRRWKAVRKDTAKPPMTPCFHSLLKERALACRFVLKLEGIHPSLLSSFCGAGVAVEPREASPKDPLPVGRKSRRRSRKQMDNAYSTQTKIPSAQIVPFNRTRKRKLVVKSLRGMELPTGVHMTSIPSSSSSECPPESAEGSPWRSIDSPVISAVPMPSAMSPAWTGGNASSIGLDPCLGVDVGEDPSTPSMLPSDDTFNGTRGLDLFTRRGRSEVNTAAAFSPSVFSWDMVSPYDSQVDNDFHLCVSSESEGECDAEGSGENPDTSCGSVDMHKTTPDVTFATLPAMWKEVASAPPPVVREGVVASAPPPVVREGVVAAAPPPVMREGVVAAAPPPVMREGVVAAAPPLAMPEKMDHFLGGVSNLKRLTKGLTWHPLIPPLSAKDLSDSAHLYHIPSVVHAKPIYSNHKDVQPAKRVGGKVLRVASSLPRDLKEFQPSYLANSVQQFSNFGLAELVTSHAPPSSERSRPPLLKGKKNNVILTPARPPPCPKALAALPIGAVREEERGKMMSVCNHKEEGIVKVGKVVIEGRGQTLKKSKRVLEKSPNVSLNASGMVTSQLEGPTPANTCGFKINQSVLCSPHDIHQVQHLTCMSLEVHVHTRGKLRPDPELDPILAVFYFIHSDSPAPDNASENSHTGVIAIDIHNAKFTSFHGKPPPPPSSPPHSSHMDSRSPLPSVVSSPNISPATTPLKDKALDGYLSRCGLPSNIKIVYAPSEHKLLDSLIQLVRETDPDFLIGYEVMMSSWGYLVDRAAAINVDLRNLLSRMPHEPTTSRAQNDFKPSTSSSSRRDTFDLRVPGRIVLDVWRYMRHEVTLTGYTFENMCFHTLHKRLPHFSHQTLTSWYNSAASLFRYQVLEYYLERSHCNYVLLEKFNLIGRTSEFARLYGIEFESVANRGSQYKVESMMLRIAKPANYIAVSPSTKQRARMAAPECVPLVMEPESKYYEDPVILLDFQSLYPSIVIAYNYCYSTCLGRFHNLSQDGEFKFGTNLLNVPNSILKKLRGNLHISPNGVAFVKKRLRKGILPTMLEEILDTRIMVKKSMKAHKSNKLLQRVLNARQLALKLVANTTFGYTAASYSGRMPCIEIADSIVQKGRETLDRAIQLVHATPEWGGRVVYGDTDSLFVMVKGVSKDEAFRIGKEICERVTAQNPQPVKLKLEKVYLPCILQSKKRYVGLSYESPDQSTPTFDAKGIETVRRDNCPAVGKILQRSLEILFKSRNVSLVKLYVQRQFRKVLEGNVNIQDYTIAKEYRGHDYYRPGAVVPALHLTKKSLVLDRRSEPRHGERVPYVIVCGSPGLPLIQLVRRPQELLNPESGLRLNASYYITKQIIPPLDRAFSLLGVDVREWYLEGSKVIRTSIPTTRLGIVGSRRPQGTIGHYFASKHCPICSRLTVEGVCTSCQRDPQRVSLTLTMRALQDEQTHADISQICANCVGCQDPSLFMQCDSLDCPVLHRRSRAHQDLAASQSWKKLLV